MTIYVRVSVLGHSNIVYRCIDGHLPIYMVWCISSHEEHFSSVVGGGGGGGILYGAVRSLTTRPRGYGSIVPIAALADGQSFHYFPPERRYKLKTRPYVSLSYRPHYRPQPLSIIVSPRSTPNTLPPSSENSTHGSLLPPHILQFFTGRYENASLSLFKAQGGSF